MASIKEKLQERLDETFDPVEPEQKSILTEEEGNVIPFRRNVGDSVTAFVPDFAVTIAQARERIAMLQEFVREMMVPGVDYGYIPNCPKPTLLKPGAEKLTDIYGLSKHIEVINRVENWEQGFFAYEVKATLISKRTGFVEAQGVGSCNSREKKYKCSDGFSVCNTILKMAKKRALVDAVLSATRSSGIFTQDVEDLGDLTPSGQKPPEQQRKQKPTAPTESAPATSNTKVNKQQLAEIIRLVAEKKLPVDDVKKLMLERYSINESKELTSVHAEDFVSHLKNLKPKRQRKATTATNA